MSRLRVHLPPAARTLGAVGRALGLWVLLRGVTAAFGGLHLAASASVFLVAVVAALVVADERLRGDRVFLSNLGADPRWPAAVAISAVVLAEGVARVVIAAYAG